MKSDTPSTDPLDRLLRSAARIPSPSPVPACESLSIPARARVLAAWRRSLGNAIGEGLPAGLGLWLRAGFASAVLVAATAVIVSWSSIRPSATDDEYAVANATLYVALAP
ncbi:MAG: hypothetical protein KIT22_08135 [Verrucomicrobiae bacterium]|nr:hypothetical protein [Verrucomicrobiae bacterium]